MAGGQCGWGQRGRGGSVAGDSVAGDSVAGGQRGRVVRGPDLQFGGPEFKSLSDH